MKNKKMDIFNKKKIKELEDKIQILEKQIKETKEETKEIKCFQLGEIIPEGTYLELISQYLKAIMDYLNIEIRWEWKDDPNYLEPPKKQIRVWRAFKKNKTIKTLKDEK